MHMHISHSQALENAMMKNPRDLNAFSVHACVHEPHVCCYASLFFLRVQDEKLKRNLDNDYPIMMVDLRGSISPLSRLKKRVDIGIPNNFHVYYNMNQKV